MTLTTRSARAQVSGRTLRLSQPLTTALFPGARTEHVATKAANVKFTLTDEAGRCYGMALVFKRYNTGCGAGRFRLCAKKWAATRLQGGMARTACQARMISQGVNCTICCHGNPKVAMLCSEGTSTAGLRTPPGWQPCAARAGTQRMRSAVAALCSPATERTHARQAAQADAACHKRRRLTRHVTDWAEFATALGLRDGDVIGITRAAPSAGGGGPDEVVALAAALRSRAVCCQPPTYAGAPGARLERRACPASCTASCGVHCILLPSTPGTFRQRRTLHPGTADCRAAALTARYTRAWTAISRGHLCGGADILFILCTHGNTIPPWLPCA